MDMEWMYPVIEIIYHDLDDFIVSQHHGVRIKSVGCILYRILPRRHGRKQRGDYLWDPGYIVQPSSTRMVSIKILPSFNQKHTYSAHLA